MSATPPRCFRCSASASRYGRCTPCNSPTTPATAPGAAASSAAKHPQWSQGIEERGVLGECDGVLSGYLGSPDTAEAVLDCGRAREGRKSGGALLLRSGDRRRRPRRLRAPRHPGIHQQRMLPVADIVTPNQFELDYSRGRRTATMADLAAAIDAVHAPGRAWCSSPRCIPTTHPTTASIWWRPTAPTCCRLRTPRLPHRRERRRRRHRGTVPRASTCARARPPTRCRWRRRRCSGCSSRTAEAGSAEMLLVEAQEEIVRRARVFPPQR